MGRERLQLARGILRTLKSDVPLSPILGNRSCRTATRAMERIVRLHIEKLPEGFYLATSDQVQGLVAQGRTVVETLEIARDVARKLLEERAEREQLEMLENIDDSLDYPLVVGI